MASRKDQLNAYTFARRRTVAAYLQPSSLRTGEGAPRPLRALVPSIAVATLVLVGFGAWGIIKPTAPKGWDKPGEYLIVGSDSTTRYVVLQDQDAAGRKGPSKLHPVLNLASAKLLLDQGKGQVIKVKESVLDSGKVPHGPTIGIPYAPDRLPSEEDAGRPKKWAVCERPAAGGDRAADKAVLVLGGRDLGTVEGRRRLAGAQALYVRGPDDATYLVDPHGTRFLLGGEQWRQQSTEDANLLRRALFGEAAQPQRVTKDWLDALSDGGSIFFPEVPGLGETSTVGGLDASRRTVGTVLRAEPGGQPAQYLVMRDRVERVSDFTANLLLLSKAASRVYSGTPKALDVSLADINPDDTPFAASLHWPDAIPDAVNTAAAHSGTPRTVVCGVYRGSVNAEGRPSLSVWAGATYPADITDGATSAYVTPGTGLLYREVSGGPGSGAQYLVTDTGLRYSVSSNHDSDADQPVTGRADSPELDPVRGEAQIRLGYAEVAPLPAVPRAWSSFLSKGPALNTQSAAQPQGS